MAALAAFGFGLIVMILGLWLSALATGWSLPYLWLGQGLDLLKANPWESMTLGILLVLLGLLILLRPQKAAKLSFAVPSRLGEVRVTQEALREIISRTALSLQGIRYVESSLWQRPEGLEITAVSQLNPDVVVTEIAEELQTIVKRDVEHYAGLRVAEVKVLVRNLETARPARVR
ncbi:MAG: alkaline shock response membrane anchor protein AmaP [Desulfitobacteriaceae bacterium]